MPLRRVTDSRMIMSFLQVGLGGAIGAMLRFGMVSAMARVSVLGMPVGVLGVNVLGSFLMGMVTVYTLQKGLLHLNPLLIAGILGGFTTFSAFSLDAFTLYERGAVGAAATYVLLSVSLSIGGLVLGILLARGIWG